MIFFFCHLSQHNLTIKLYCRNNILLALKLFFLYIYIHTTLNRNVITNLITLSLKM